MTASPPRALPLVDPVEESAAAHAPSWYAASANASPARPPLLGDHDLDVCVVGAGFTGLSAALHLAEAGRTVTVLDGARVGWGASGRNGGQIVNGLNAGLDIVERRYGADTASFVGTLLQEGAEVIRGFVARHAIDCDLERGNVYVAFNAKQMRALEAKQALWRRHGMDDHELLDRAALAAHVRSPLYVGGMLDRSGGHLHPLNLALGEAAALESLGGTVHERTRVVRLENEAGGGERPETRPVVVTEHGRLRCRTLILAGNAYLGRAVPALAARVMPVSTQVMATEPLADELAREILPSNVCVEDVRYILDYYRLTPDRGVSVDSGGSSGGTTSDPASGTADGASGGAGAPRYRLLFGGGTVYGGTDPADVEAKLRPHMEKVFPQLAGTRVTHAWSGNFALSFSRVPQLGRLGPQSYYAMGYSGHGVTGSHLFGRLLAEAIEGRDERFGRFAALPWIPFPGGQRFRAPYSTLGSWWYALRDRVGI